MQIDLFTDEGLLGPPFDPEALADFGACDMPMQQLTTRSMTKADYDFIVRVIDKWWGGPTSALAHPIFFYELGREARVVEADGKPVGFLFGFLPCDPSVGYIHLVGIDPDYRRQHVGSLLYQAFEEACAKAGCQSMKAMTTLGNQGSVRFHEALGWSSQQVEDYAGPGRARVVFTKSLRQTDEAARLCD
jgi:ribosomal protein S18 acetylase RimI-like enzyme